MRVAAIALSLLILTSLSGGCGPYARGPEAFTGTVLRSGISDDVEFEVLAEGAGEETVKGDWVLVHYRLLLVDGTLIDSSHNKKPLAMFAGKDRKVIEGFQLGVVGMKVGELRRIKVPHHLGYGERAMDKIPVKSTLIFELELISRPK